MAPAEKSDSVIIVGGGIGGLVLALQLHAIGYRNIDIFEAAPQIAGIGLGINVQPSAILVLRNLGLLDRLLATGIETEHLNYYNRHGNMVLTEPRGQLAGYAIPQLSIHRGEFHSVLYEAAKETLGPERIHLDHAFTGFTPHDASNEISATFISRSDPTRSPKLPSKKANMIIAADGIWSTTRKLLYPNEGPPRFSGQMLWRGVMETEPIQGGKTMIWAGHADQKFIAYPISKAADKRGKSLVNWIAELRIRAADDPDKTPPNANWTNDVPKEKFAGKFETWDLGFLKVRDMIAAADVVYETPMCDRDPVDKWSFGRLTLLGDAAHPMYPIGSNGATQSILDARELAIQLLKHNDVEVAFKEYEKVRLPATAAIVRANRGQGPDLVLELAEKRAPDGFTDVYDVIPREELEAVGQKYKVVAGFDIDTVNKRAEEPVGLSEIIKHSSKI